MQAEMETIQNLFRKGHGPSSSHTIGPERAAHEFALRNPEAVSFAVTLYGSLSLTGKGHLTDRAITEALKPREVEVRWSPESLPRHPNGMDFEALSSRGSVLSSWRVYSVGGGALRDEESFDDAPPSVYPLTSFSPVLSHCAEEGKTLWQYAAEHEDASFMDYLASSWEAMKASIDAGINAEGVLPGSLKVPRKASGYFVKAQNSGRTIQDMGLIFAYALAVSEENAAGGLVVTAPTCGSAGVLPAVLCFLQKLDNLPDSRICKALATAGLIGNFVKANASISGAEVGCQGEIGTACAMAAGAAAQILGGTPPQIEYAAEMGLEHHLGLTCDPVGGYVQIPCIERNAVAAGRAFECAVYALLSDGRHKISFDQVVETMAQTGKDLQSQYRETGLGGLAGNWDKYHRP